MNCFCTRVVSPHETSTEAIPAHQLEDVGRSNLLHSVWVVVCTAPAGAPDSCSRCRTVKTSITHGVLRGTQMHAPASARAPARAHSPSHKRPGDHRWRQPTAQWPLRLDQPALAAALAAGPATEGHRVYVSRATLVVVPPTLVGHWMHQIATHTVPGTGPSECQDGVRSYGCSQNRLKSRSSLARKTRADRTINLCTLSLHPAFAP